MASSIPYNNDVDMTPDDNLSNQTYNVQINDDSSHSGTPSIDPIPVSDTSSRIIDNWVKDLTPTGGEEGTKYNDTPPTEKSPIPEPVYKTVTRKVRESIKDYSRSYLNELYNKGAKFYVIYTDGTENEVSYTEIYNPHPIQTGTYINEAQEIADAINQHFWDDDSGAHVTDVEQDVWKTAANANFNDLSDSKPYHNILMNSLGILLRRALYNLVSISKSAVTFYDGLGNNISNIRASFGSAGATFRENGKTKATITTQGLSIFDNDGSVSGNNETLGTRLAFIGIDDSGKPYSRIGKSTKGYIDIGVNSSDNGYIDFYNGSTLLAHIGYDDGTNISGGTSLAPYYNLGLRKASSIIGNYSLSEGYNTVASNFCSHAEGYNTVSSGHSSHVEGYETTASDTGSHAEGWQTNASGGMSHAEGRFTKATGGVSHAEGERTEASGEWSHSEGAYTKAIGDESHAGGRGSYAEGNYSHAEGYYTNAGGHSAHAEGAYTIASGDYSHASGYYTKATHSYKFVCGKYNIDKQGSLFEVGYGTGDSNDKRKNAFTVYNDGTAYLQTSLSAAGYRVESDSRVKTLIDELTSDTSIKFIKQLKPKHYYKHDVEEYGFYAQEVEEIPEFGEVLVTKDTWGLYDLPDYRLLNYQGMIAPIVSVEQDLISRVEQLEAENKELKLQNEKLNKRLDDIEQILANLNS